MPDPWYRLVSGAGAPAWNMALDDALFEAVAPLGRPVLRTYAWSEPAATFGYFQAYEAIAATTRLRPLIRRPTGGGLVPHLQDWTYAVMIPPAHPWYGLRAVDSYRRMHEWLQRALAACGCPTELAPCCREEGPGQCFVGWEKFDLLHGGAKLAGAAQRRNRDGLLIQGSLQPPPSTVARSAFESALLHTAPDGPVEWHPLPLSPELLARAGALAGDRYGSDTHQRRR